MKKPFLLGLFFSVCGGATRQSEFLQHDTHYKNMDPLVFSWCGGG